MNITERLHVALRELEAAIEEAGDQLKQQPDNPAIKRIGDSRIRAFVIQSSTLFRSPYPWDPFFHDWKAQYEYAYELLKKRRFAALRDLLQAQTYLDPSHGRRSFAPEVIEHVKAITGDLLNADDLTGKLTKT